VLNGTHHIISKSTLTVLLISIPRNIKSSEVFYDFNAYLFALKSMPGIDSSLHVTMFQHARNELSTLKALISAVGSDNLMIESAPHK
jgi:hypothetical protein